MSSTVGGQEGEALLANIQEEENERPGDGDIEFDAIRFGLPSPSVLFLLLEWVTPERRRLLSDPGLLRNPQPEGPVPPVCLKATRKQ